jgi:hypothetical protein
MGVLASEMDGLPDMKGPFQITSALLLSAVLGAFSVAQSVRSRFDPAGHQGSAKPQDSFLDFTLKRINPSDTDYGKCLGESRTALLDETVRNAYFWSNIVALEVLGFLFVVVLYQHKTQTKREWAVAEIIEQLQHNLNRSRAQVAEATRKNRDLAEALAASKESALRSPSLSLESTKSVAGTTAKPHAPNIQTALPAPARATLAKPQNESAGRTSTAKEPVSQMRLFTPDADFVMKLNSLEQQLAQSREDNKQLRRRIADGDRKVEAEQRDKPSAQGCINSQR